MKIGGELFTNAIRNRTLFEESYVLCQKKIIIDIIVERLSAFREYLLLSPPPSAGSSNSESRFYFKSRYVMLSS
jgi:hypothetical protein